MSQIASSKYFYSDYWGNWISQAGIECGTASISMALSYIGIDRDADYILDYGNGATYFGESWGGATYLTPTVSTAMSNSINGGGKYSPPIIHLDNYSTLGHYVVLAGKISGTTYQVLDPAQNSTWNITFNGSTATYTRNGYTVTDTVTYASQYYNPSASLENKLTEPVISGCTVPTELKVGDVFTVAGTVYAPSAITKVTVGCYDANGNAKTSASATPKTTSYDIGNLDYYVEFNTLAAGTYYYKVTVTTASGTTTLVNSKFTVADPNAITISGHSVPTTMNEGEVFIVKGTVKSGLKLTKVVVGCYDANGTMLTGGSATPNATSYSLANLDAYVEFNTLPAGTYYYKVKATNSAGTTTLVNAKFTVADENTMTLTGNGTPSVLTVGSPFSVKGVIDSGTKITKVTVGCYDATGAMLTGASATPNATTYDVSKLDTDVLFNELEPGVYRYKITATNAGGSTVLQNSAFTVLANGRTVADGLYALVPSSSTGYAIHVAGDSTASGANVELAVKETSEFMAMRVKHVGSGYYTLEFFGSGKLLTVHNAGTANSTNVNQATASGADSQKWQILPTGKGYCLVPKHATAKALDIKGGTMAAGTNVQIYTRKLSNAQQFNLEKMDVSKVTISGHSVPTTITVGGVFSVKGTITANEKLTKVTVGCYDINGKLLTGASATPNAKTYNVANLDYDVEFNVLTPGVYYYRITTVTASGSKRIVNSAFTVLANSRTVADGVYMLRAVGNSGYAVDVTGSSNKNSANVDLGVRSTTSKYQAIRVKHVGSGYYTLQFVGSGMYLTVAGGGTSSGTNVRQNVPNNSNYQKWQILPVGSGYCLVPKHATTMALDIKGGTYADGTNVQMYKRNLGKAQRFTLEASTAAKSKLTGCSTPTTLSVGGVFTVKGTVTSTETITKVQVQVVNASGTVLTGASAAPKAKSYNIGNLDYYVEFNILPKGTYYYKITATTASGTEVLINSRFVVK